GLATGCAGGAAGRERRQAAAGGQHLRESVLRDWAALARGALQQRGGASLVLGDAEAVEQRYRIFDLCIGIVGGRGGAEPAGRLAQILADAAALLVERGKRILRLRAPRLRGGAEQFCGARKVLRE